MMTRKITTETITKTADFEVIYFKGIDLDVCYSYQVYKNEQLDHECDDRQEALDYVTEEQEAIDQERADQVQAMRDEAWDLVASCEDEATLKKVLALLKRAK